MLVLPFGGVRVTCFDSPRPEAPASSAQVEAISDCERMCPFHPPAEEPATAAGGASATSDTGDDTGCALSSDSMSVSMFGNIAILRPEEPLQAPTGAAPLVAAAQHIYLEPDLSGVAPPPKHLAS